jgi:ribose 5-phosphate isomerase B
VTTWALGYDHAGYQMAQTIAAHLDRRGDESVHFGPEDDKMPVDYARYCIAAAEAVQSGECEFGIVLGGTGQGEQIAANKVKGIRAALCLDTYLARLAKRDNDANVIAIPARMIAGELALQIIDEFANMKFEGGRHARRLSEIHNYERGTLDTAIVRRK